MCNLNHPSWTCTSPPVVRALACRQQQQNFFEASDLARPTIPAACPSFRKPESKAEVEGLFLVSTSYDALLRRLLDISARIHRSYSWLKVPRSFGKKSQMYR